MAPNAIYVGYMLVSLGLLMVVYTRSAFDLRGVGKIRRRKPLMAADEADYEDDDLERRADYSRPEQIMIMPRADLTMLVAVFGALGVILGAAIGFAGPRIIDELYASRSAGDAFSWMASKPLERVAQITGAMCLGLIALRMFRIFLVLAGFASLAIGAHAAVAYTLGREIWAPLGF